MTPLPKGSPDSIRFDALVHPNEAWPDLVSRWQRLEQAGLDGIWTCDHYAPVFDPTGSWFEGATTLMALAAATTRVRIGLLVGAIASRPPALFASEAKTIDHASGGRLDIGLGAGGSAIDDAMTGRDSWDVAERADRFREYVDLVDRMCHESVVTYRGKYYAVDGAIVSPPLVQQPRPPITLAANGARTIEVVARFADTWNTYGPTFSAAVDLSAKLDAACERIGREPRTLRRSVLLGAFPDTSWTTEEQFEDLVAAWWQAGFTQFVIYAPPFAMGELRAAAPAIGDLVISEVIPELRSTLLIAHPFELAVEPASENGKLSCGGCA